MKKTKVLNLEELAQIKGGDVINSNGVAHCICEYNDTNVTENQNDVDDCKCLCVADPT